MIWGYHQIFQETTISISLILGASAISVLGLWWKILNRICPSTKRMISICLQPEWWKNPYPKTTQTRFGWTLASDGGQWMMGDKYLRVMGVWWMVTDIGLIFINIYLLYIYIYILYIYIYNIYVYIYIFIIYMYIYIYIIIYMDVSENNIGTPKSSINYTRGFHYKPSILGYPYFWKHPYIYMWFIFPKVVPGPWA